MTEFKKSDASNLREIVALGKRYSKSAFPNLTREGCPSRASLWAMAYRDRRLQLKGLPVSHVVSCSPCFKEYGHFRILYRGIQGTAGALVALAILTVGFVWKNASPQSETLISHKQFAPPQSPPQINQPKPLLGPLPISVDLASLSPTRGNDSQGETRNAVHLPQKFVRVNFGLPLGMEPGEYEIRLQDPTGSVIVGLSSKGQVVNGTTSLVVDFDLSSTSRGNFTLMIRPPGLSWRRFPVVIN